VNWKKPIISALRKGNLDAALEIASKVEPEEIFSLLKDFPEDNCTPYIAAFLNKMGNLYWDAQMFFSAENAFRKALKKYQSLAKEDPAYIHEIAVILNNLGTLYGQIGKFSKAETALHKALKIRRDLAKESPEFYAPELASTLNNLGALFLDRGKFFKAEKFFAKALKIRRDLAKENPDIYNPDVAMTLNNLGTVYCQTGKFQKAEKAYNESLKIRRTLAEENQDYISYVAMTLNNLGLLYKDTQEFSEAENVYNEALTIRRSLAKENPVYIPQVAMTLNNLGILYRDTQKYSEAEKAFTEALEKYKTLGERLKYTFQVGMTLNNLGSLYRTIGRFYEAEKAFTEALKECEALAKENPDYTPLVAMSLNNLGLLYWDTKRLDEAEKVHKEALKEYRTLEKENPDAYAVYVALALNNMGAIYLDKKEFDEAEETYKEALKKYRALAHQNRAYTFHVAGILNNLGLLYKDTQKYSEAEKAFAEALDRYKQLASWFYAANTAYNLSQIKLDGEHLETSRKLLEMAILFSREELYAYAQKGEREHIYWGLLEQDVSSFSVLEALRDPERLSLSWEQVLLREELEKAQKNVEFQKFFVDKVLKKSISPIQIPIKLPGDVLFVYIQKIKNSPFFFVVTREGIEKFKGKREFFIIGIKLLYLLRFQLRAAGKPRLITYAEKFDELAREWYEILPPQLKKLIQEKSQIIFSPDYYCSFFPLEALQINGQPLCMEKTVVRATSLHQFLTLSRTDLCFDSSLIVGNPWPNCSKKELIYSSPSDSKQFRILFLNGAEEEAEALAEKLPNTTVLLKQQATGEKFLSDVSKHSLIHFCGHGRLGRILFLCGPLQGFPPQFEPREFSDLRKVERSEGIRKVNMMEEWHPVTDLDLFNVKLTDGAVIFLNACETGWHKYAGGGYYQGLPTVFLKNGAHSVVSSLIPIFDNPSKEFAIKFYETLLHTQSVSESLKKTRIWSKNKYKAQIYWIPYIHYGPPA